MGEERESAYRRLVKRELDRVVEGMGIQPGRTHWEKVSQHGFVDPVKASSGESPEVKIDLDRSVGLRWDVKHDVGAKDLVGRVDRAKLDRLADHWGVPVESITDKMLRSVGLNLIDLDQREDLGVIRDGQWVRVADADPPVKPGEALYPRRPADE